MNLRTALRRGAWIGGAGVAAGVAAGTAAALGVGAAGYLAWRRWRMDDISGQVVLITGASRGLGLAMARQFAQLGCQLVICARDEQELNAARLDLLRFGTRVLAVTCDIGSAAEVEQMVAKANAEFGRIDILINNAGVISVGPLESQTLNDYQEAMRTMFWGVVYPTLAVMPQMIERRSGRIANITSIGGKISVPHLVPYCCAKFAAVGFSEGLHAELRRHGVRVTTVVPGLMRTGSHLNAYFKGQHRAEFTWFALSATAPLLAMDANRAARKVVAAVRRGSPEIILSPQARAAAIAHGLAPGIFSEAMALGNMIMPKANGEQGKDRHLGRESETAVTRSPLTALGRSAAREFNQQDSDTAKQGTLAS